jgi:predicted lipid-binding transport protein (Tim44 family)
VVSLKKNFFSFLALLLAFCPAFALACPFCSENLSKNSGGFNHGLTMGIMITIFMFLGIIGSIAGFIVHLMIKEGKKSELRHQLAQEQASLLPSPIVPN